MKLDRNSLEDIIGLTPTQEGMLFHYLFNRDSEQYFEQLSLRLEGYIDTDKIREAWNFVIDANSMLRTVFRWDSIEKPMQIILKSKPIQITEYDFSHEEKSVWESLLSKTKEKDRKSKIDIGLEPFRVSLCKLCKNEFEMILSYHHIIIDGWSTAIIIKEFFDSYNSLVEGTKPEFLKKSEFKEFVKWLQKQDKVRNSEYWGNYLLGFEEKTQLPVESIKKDGEYSGKKYECFLSENFTQEAAYFCIEHGINLATLLNVTWGILLQRYSNCNDVVFGATVSGRTPEIKGIENIVGLFINTIPFRVKTDGNEKVIDFLKKMDTEFTENFEFQAMALVDIKACTKLSKQEEIFNSIVIIQNYPLGIDLNKLGGKLKVKHYSMLETTNYDLNLEITTTNDIKLNFMYNGNKISCDAIHGMAKHYRNILNAIIEKGDIGLDEITILSDDEKKQILYEFNNTYEEYPRDKTVYEFFEEQAEKTPDNIAVIYEDKQLTYRELNGKSNRLARVLREKGVVPDSIVGIMVERSIDMIVGILGILKAGGAYLPIDSEYPKDRIEYMLEDSNADILITRKQYIGNIADTISTIIDIEDISLISGMPEENINAKYDTNRKMYLIYTSGSTGNPKGAAVRADSFMNLTNWFTKEFNISESDNILLIAPVGFDLAQKNLYAALVKGGRLCILPERTYNYTKVLKIIHKERITIINCTPSAFQLIIDAATDYHELEYLRWVFLGGEPINTAKLVKWTKSQYYRAEIVNTYGPTECTDIAAYYKISKQEIEDMAVIPIGKPIDNVKLYIVDKNNNLLPVGHQGELCIGGVSLGMGYLNRPELTAEKFVPNPFEPGERMYKTGDLTRWLPDGNIEFLGRIDHQVKIRGFRIELGEIESQLLKHEAVGEAVVAAKEDQGGNKYLCAYLTAGKVLTVSELREYLRQELPDYMVPSYFVQLPKMPLTPNGKIDRKALPEPDGSIETGEEYEAPRNGIEEKLVKIWQEVLGAEKIGINDNFFDLGGHSLKATSMVSKIHKELNVEVPLREVFKTPTIKGLSEYMKGHGENIYAAIEPVEEKEYYKASSAQKRLYTLQQFDLGSTAYNISGVLEVEGKLDVERLKEVFKALIKRHESLRTSFEIAGEEIVQKIHEEAVFEIEHWDKLSSQATREETEEIIKGFVRAFDLSKAPLLRVGLISFPKEKQVAEEKYILMYDMHHIISDGTSIGILTDEFMKLYAGEELKELKIQYKDYSAWQNGMIESEIMQKQEEYWLKEYWGETHAEEIPVLNLPADYPRPAMQSFEGDSIYFELEEDITEGLRKTAKETGTTLYMLLLTSFNILLSKYSGQEDIVVGSPIAGRPHADLENIIGMFVNTLAIRSNPEGKKTYREYLDEVKAKCLKAYENQDYQFEELIEKLKVRRDMSRNALFDVMLVLQNTEIGELAIEGLRFREYEGGNKVAKFDITINAVELEKKIGLSIEYCTKLFSRETIESLGGHLANIIANTITNQDIRLSEIDILTAEEKQKLLYTFNNTHAEYPREKTIHELFEAQAEKTPDKIAVVYEDKQLTYRELNERANQLARVLLVKGVSQDSIVGIMAERSLEMIIGIMGILKAGGAYLPIDPAYPADRMQYMLADSQAGILLTHKGLGSKIGGAAEQINLDEESLYQGESGNPDKAYDAGSLAYVIYTSGSTGKPKGVMIEHRNVLNTLTGLEKAYPVNEEDAYLLKTAYTFDVSVTELFGWFVGKGRLEILTQGKEKDPGEITKAIEERGITHINFVPSMLKLWIEELGKGDRPQLGKLKYVMAAGEVLSGSTVESFYKEEKQAGLENIYGPTEITIYATRCSIERNKSYGNIAIGKPMQNVKAYILDCYNKLQPVGIPGELCIAGESLARGYLNRAELTAEKFVDNPFEPGTKMYRTGDLVRWLSDGNIEFLGRMDQQVKIRGYRIELGEIENQLLSYQAVKEVIVTAKEDRSGSKYLCAYIAGERDFKVAELRQHLGKELPDYMIPSYFVQLEKLPLTASGKIDRTVLPEPDGSMASGTTYEAPTDAMEEKLVSIWQEILKADKIGIRDNFFELGGHSLKATGMAAKIQKELEAEILLKEIFEGPTIKEIAAKIKEKEKVAYIKIEPIEEKEYYKASSAQKRLYTLQQFDLESTGYNMPMVLKLRGELDKQKLENIFKQLIERHEALRTFFEIRDEEIVQKVDQAVAFQINDYGYMETESEAVIQESIRGFVRAFDLSKAPLFRVSLMSFPKEKQVRQDEYILMVDMHHIITDGVSMGILTKDFVELYEGKALPDLPIQYKDYSAWQNEMIETGKMQNQEDYWVGRFSDELPILNMPTDYQRPGLQSFEGDSIGFKLDKETTQKLNWLAKQTGTTLYMLLLSAYNILLSRYSSQEDIIIGSPIAGRTHGDLENIIGMFVNTLAMRNFPESSKTFSAFLGEVKENTLKAYENQEYQFEELVEKVNLRRDLSRNPIFDVMFAMQNMDAENMVIEDLEISYYDAGNKISKFDMSLNAVEAEDKIWLSLEYCTKLFKKETAERLLKHYINILKAITVNKEIRLGEIELISRQEKEQILEVFNNTKADYPRDMTIHELFEAQVEKTPDKVAVIYEDMQLTYRELNERANRLAVILRQKGAAPDALVGIMAERSIEMVIGIMAVLKAGGAYVPIDPEYPEDRVAYMLADSDASILLTQRALKDKVQFDGDIIELEDECPFCDNKENLKHITTSENLAYVLYTSGTTGRPKGVMIEHKSVVNITYAWKKDYKLDTFDVRLLQMASFSFDVSMGDMSRALLNGGMMVICPSHSKLDFKQLYQLITKYQISILELTPAYAIQFMDYIHTNRFDVTHIKLLILGSDSCPMEEFIKLKKQYGHSMRIINSYGLTEVTIDSSFYEDSSLENQMIGNVPIGRPMQNTMFYILDKGGNLLPAGIAGELCIGGDGLSRGYLNKPELTAEKFVGSPFEPGKGMYRTGDLAKWLPDGNVAFLGRIDHQVKIRGYRIELGEIESELLNYDAVKEAVVIARENDGSNYLCAYIAGNKELTVAELREHLNKELPDYMIPSYFVQLEKLPLTANGKIDRKALPEPDGSMTSGTIYEAPSDAIEEKLVSIWQEILKIDKIGIRDNFFELGGHSLKATGMLAKINKELEAEIPLKEIFQGPTIKELGKKIREKERAAFIKIEPVEEKEYYELSSAQKRIYTLQQFDVGSTGYNMPGVLEIEGELNLKRVEEAFKSLIKRHEALRTSFQLRETGPVQRIHKEAAIEIEYREIKTGNDLPVQVSQALRTFIRPFDLSRVPLLRVGLIRLWPQVSIPKYILLFDMHHIISDGTSIGILVEEFGKVYNGEALKALRIQYKDYCAWQGLACRNGHYASEKKRDQEQYWIEKFSGQIPVLNLPTDYPRPNIQSFEGDSLNFELDKELAGGLRETAKQTGSTLYMVLLAGLNILLSKYSGQEDIVVGSPIAGRPHADLENILGMFVNTLAMRNYPEGNKTFRAFLQEVKDNALTAYENENYQFDELVDKLNAPRDLSRNPLFDVMFVLQDVEIEAVKLEGIEIRPYPVEYKTSKFDMTFTATEDRDKIHISIEYCTKLYKRETAENIAYSYKAVLSKITHNLDILLSEIALESSLKKAKVSQEAEADFNF